MARLLVTGGAGFIGANFVDYWLEKNPNDHVVVLDALTFAGNIQSIEQLQSRRQFSFVQGDIVDSEQVISLLSNERIDTVVHFAAESHVDRSIVDPNEFVRTNVLGTQSLLEAARRVWLNNNIQHRFHHVSTDASAG
ncbi:MAG: GDP-mannose 4,6-dehydratase [Pseudomonadota bacterium]